MTDLEFDVLDELYFLISFAELQGTTGISEIELKSCLQSMWKKGWVRCYKNVSTEARPEEINWELQFNNYYYLASKEGLLMHNGKD